MKIQKLIIHNIASIEDATIDFEQEPLNTSEVFLITGKTGSGKSTILDAICLALYADTPRLSTTKMQGDTSDGDKKITIRDPRQLMRHNTGEAFSSLTFIGKNGIHYEAQWSITRAHGKIKGNLQSKSWALKNLDTNEVLDKDKQIQQEIKEAIGLDFTQFCRTTMLAQGDFTRFLNSEDNEKAAILEKITGVDIYSKIGAKVYAATMDKKSCWEVAKQLIEGITTFSDDEIAEKKLIVKNLKDEYNTQKKLSDDEIAKRTWIQTDTELNKKVGLVQEELITALQKTESEDFKQQETLVKDWNVSIEARNWLIESKNAKDIQDEQEKKLENLSKEYSFLLEGQEFANEEILKIDSNIKTIDSLLKKENDKISIYENSQTIAGQLKIVVDGRANIAKNNAEIKTENENLTKLQEDFKNASRKEKTAKEAFSTQEKEVDKNAKEVDELQLSDLRTLHNQLSELIKNIDIANERLETLVSEQTRMAKKTEELEKRKKVLDDKILTSANMSTPLREAKIIMDSKKEDLEKQKDTIDKFAITLRQKLHKGDTCPVCRQKLSSELPHEEALSKLISGLENSYQEAKTAYENFNNKKINIDAEIKNAQESYDSEKASLDKDTTVATASQKALDACIKCGINAIDGNTAQSLKELKTETANEKAELEKKIEDGEKKETVLKELRKKLDNQRKEVESISEASRKAEQDVRDCQNRINTAKKLLETKQDEVQKAENQIQKAIGSTQWENNWHDQPTEFSKELTSAAKTYDFNLKQKDLFNSNYRTAKDNFDNVQNIIDKIRKIESQWTDICPDKVQKVDKILEKANQVYTDVATTLDRLDTAKTTYKQKQSLINNFIKEHPNIELERLHFLNTYTSEQIGKKNSLLEDSHDNVKTKKATLETLQKQQSEHQQNKPTITENDSIELLDKRITELSDNLREITEKTGAINQELLSDEENKKKLADLIADAETKKEDYQKWSRLNELIGDSTGNKFRKIAQSYVLTNLIHSANHYMRTLTSRYTLKVQPGTFVILIEDAFQGFSTRAASTISGGESFLVSLALALALSDIGQSLAVDTLFIDEGFGTLSGEPLQNAINTLRTLHNHSGRHVGIISHVEELQERIPVQIQVNQDGNNSSSQIKIIP